MRKTPPVIFLLLLIMALVARGEGPTLFIYYSADLYGAVEPCG